MFSFYMLCDVGSCINGSGQTFLARAQCTSYTQIPPLVLDEFEVVGIPPSLKSQRWRLLHRCHDLPASVSHSVWNESSTARVYCGSAKLRGLQRCHSQICPWEKQRCAELKKELRFFTKFSVVARYVTFYPKK